MITYERLHKLLDYDPDTGVFTWRVNRGDKIKVGQKAGAETAAGYTRIKIGPRNYFAHRLAWLYTHGYFPESKIDHINRVPSDNRLLNLREVSQSCNIRNARIFCTNTSGVTGVGWVAKGGRWRARLTINYKTYYLGDYDDFDEAVCARLAAEQCLNWEGCDSDSPAYRYVQAWRSL
jgi:hypothetical protein